MPSIRPLIRIGAVFTWPVLFVEPLSAATKMPEIDTYVSDGFDFDTDGSEHRADGEKHSERISWRTIRQSAAPAGVSPQVAGAPAGMSPQVAWAPAGVSPQAVSRSEWKRVGRIRLKTRHPKTNELSVPRIFGSFASGSAVQASLVDWRPAFLRGGSDKLPMK